MKNAILNSKKCISFLKKDKSVPYRTRFVKWHDELKLMIRKLNIIAVCKNSPVLESLYYTPKVAKTFLELSVIRNVLTGKHCMRSHKRNSEIWLLLWG